MAVFYINDNNVDHAGFISEMSRVKEAGLDYKVEHEEKFVQVAPDVVFLLCALLDSRGVKVGEAWLSPEGRVERIRDGNDYELLGPKRLGGNSAFVDIYTLVL